MLNWIKHWRQERLAKQITRNGDRLRSARVARRGIDAGLWPEDAAAFDEEITTLERRHEALLTKFRKEN